MHVLWMNEHAALTGGCEHYVRRTAEMLGNHAVRSSLLYNPNANAEAGFLRLFEGAYPWANVAEQIEDLRPDLVYVHRLDHRPILRDLAHSRTPLVRFLHDHQLFCPRQSKYTTLFHRTCTRTVGLACYPCLGFINRSPRWPGFRLRRVGALRDELQENSIFKAFVVGSEYMASHAAAHGLDRARFHVLPLYAPLPKDPLPPVRQQNLLLFAGALLRGKGLDVLLRAMPHLEPAAQLVIAGCGHQEDMFRSLSQSLHLTERVQFLGNLTSAQLADWFRKASCLVVPSRSPETFGLVGIEAMSHGLPVIAAAVGGMREWLKDGETGLAVPPNDSLALARAIHTLLADPALARRMGTQGRLLFEQRFLPHHHTGRLLQLFQKLISDRTSA